MDEQITNAELKEEISAAETQESGENTDAQTAAAQSAEEMTDEAFEDYLKNIRENQEANQHVSNAQTQEPSDGKDEGSAAKPENEAEEEVQKPYRIFKSQDDWQRTIDRIVGDRLKGTKQQKEQLDKIVQQAAAFYGAEDTDELINRLVDDLRVQNADKRSMDIEDYRRQEKDMIDARKYREEERERQESQNRVEAIKNRWIRESEELKSLVPDFDFNAAMQDESFYNSVIEGKSLSAAYIAAKGAAAANQPRQEEQPKRRAIKQNGAQAAASGGVVNFNPETASDADFMKYINKIKNQR